MAADTTLETTLRPVAASGWRVGFGNLLSKEWDGFWGTRTWWTQLLIWFVVVQGFVVIGLVDPGESSAGDAATEAVAAAMGLFAAIGAIVLVQSAIVGEKQSGTAAWVLSKPVSRTAFVVAKFVALGTGVLTTAVLAQAAAAYVVIAVVAEPVTLGRFAAGIAVLALNLVFYLALSLWLGARSSSRSPVIAVPMTVLFAMWLFGRQVGIALPFVAIDLVAGRALSVANVTALVTTAGLTVAFAVLAVRRIDREEF